MKHLQHASKIDMMEHLRHIVETTLQHVQHPDLHLKHPDTTLAIYKRKQMKHLQHMCTKKQMKRWG
jgi:hypothetical protein